uniref:RING-type domain-containing protein n=1 Tax=Trichuris muris TaxID=70415 RepID=A0A5S6QLN2_TRIMR
MRRLALFLLWIRLLNLQFKAVGLLATRAGMSSEVPAPDNSSALPVQYPQRAVSTDEVDACQRTLLTKALLLDELECRACFEIVQSDHPIWSCNVCHNIFHFICITNWADRRNVEATEAQKVRCPVCSTQTAVKDLKEACFCGNTEGIVSCNDRAVVPHSCGSVCGRRLGTDGICSHFCSLICHPGSCPPCESFVQLECFCANVVRSMPCKEAAPFSCGAICGKLAPCERHNCQRACHNGPCFQNADSETCDQPCGRKLPCGVHYCDQDCHPGYCLPCKQDPSVVTTCPCGYRLLEVLGVVRMACTDPIPTCGMICKKRLICGFPDDPHSCQRKCHTGACTCDLETFQDCACGCSSRKVKCTIILSKGGSESWKCEVPCRKRMNCRKHICGRVCCTDDEHICHAPCGQLLNCGQHFCINACHRPPCGRCTATALVPSRCTCGRTELQPPYECGTKPRCNFLCSRPHDCSHEPEHLCHYEDVCPPCTVLTERQCSGGHMVRKVPCGLPYWICTTVCGKARPSCGHPCPRRCHPGDCLIDLQVCELPCSKPRPSCGHPCGLPCHNLTECPETPCETSVTVTCPCGVCTAQVKCKIISQSSAAAAAGCDRQITLLECNDECKRRKRSRLLAEALGTEQRDRPTFTTNYPKFLRTFYAANSEFGDRVEKELCKLLDAASRAPNGTRKCCNFPPMNKDRRKFVWEYAKAFWMEPVVYDAGSNCSVTVYCKSRSGRKPFQLLSEQMK